MIRKRTKKEVRRYDIFKLSITLILILLVFFMLLRDDNAASVASSEDDTSAAIDDESTAAYPASEGASVDEAYPLAVESSPTAEVRSAAEAYPAGSDPVEQNVAITTPQLILNEANLYAGDVYMSGSGEPGHLIVLIVAELEAGAVEVKEDGSWTLPLYLDAGTHSIGLQTLGKDGNVINQSGPFETTIQEAILPTVSLPDDDMFTGGMILTGTGQPGTKVQLFANEDVIGEASVDDSGNYTLEVSLAVGRYNIDIATLDGSGNALEIIPALSLPVLAKIKAEIELDESGMPEFDPSSGLINWRGMADPQAQLVLLIDGEESAQITADPNGIWSHQTNLAPGIHEIALRQLDLEGNVVFESKTITIELN